METILVNPILARFGLGDPDWLDPATAGVIVLIALVVAFVFHKLVFPLIVRLTNWTPTDLDSRLVKSVRWPTTFGILVLGVYLALTVPLDLTDTQQSQVDTVGRALGVMIVIMVLVGLLSSAIDWYLATLATSTTRVVDLRLLPLIRRVGGVVIYGIGVLLVAVPVVIAAGFLWLALAPTFAVCVVIMVARRAGEYALVRPGREMLYTVVPPQQKFKAKNFIDTVVYRGGDAVSGWVKRALDLLGELPGLAMFIGAGIALTWAGTGFLLGRAQRRREADSEPPGRRY